MRFVGLVNSARDPRVKRWTHKRWTVSKRSLRMAAFLVGRHNNFRS